MAETKEPSEERAPARGSGADEDHSGAELDPELLSIRGPRPRIGVVLSLSIVVLCVYLVMRLWPDLRFALADHEPVSLAPSEAIGAATERYVEIEPVRLQWSAALRISHSADPALATGHRVVPARATGGTLWVVMPGNPRHGTIRHSNTYAGRLRALADMPFADELEAHARAKGAPWFFTAEALRAALEDDGMNLAAPDGETTGAAPSTPVAVAETRGDAVELTVVSTEEHPTAERWAQALADAGALPGLQPPVAAGDGIWVFEVPGSADEIDALLADARLMSARADPVQQVHEATFGELSASNEGLVAGHATIPWDDIDGVWLEMPVAAWDQDAVLIAGEHPRDVRLALGLAALLAGFALLFSWAFIDGVRREIVARRPASPSKSDT